MIRRHVIGLVAMMVLGCLAAPAEAGGGGGGTKRSVTIKTSNAWPNQICAFSLSQADAAAGKLPKSVQDAQKNFGGVLIGPGKSKAVKVVSGKGVLGVFDVANPAVNSGAAYQLGNGSSTTAKVADDGAGNMIVTIP